MPWHNGKKINGLYSYGPQNRNSFVHVDGLGWRCLWTDYDCQSNAMTIMASYARAENRTVNLFEEGGKVKTLYVW